MATKEVELETGCLSKVDGDEPVFVLRAKDTMAPTVVRIWAMFADIAGVFPAKTDEARELAHQMDVWQREHGSKLAD